MKLAIFTAPTDVRVAGGINRRQVFLKLPYVWALPYSYRDQIVEVTSVEALAKSGAEFCIITSDYALAALESKAGLRVRESKCNYDALIGCSAQFVIASHRCRAIVAPQLHDMRNYSRTMRFIYLRGCDRFLRPASYRPTPKLNWVHIVAGQQPTYAKLFSDAAAAAAGASPDPDNKLLFISIDLETTKRISTTDLSGTVRKWGAVITACGYTFVFWRNGRLVFESYTHGWTSQEDWHLLDTVCRLPTPKTLHNGQYDLTYLTRWRIPLVNYVHDTMNWLQSVTPHMKKKQKGKETKGFYSLQYASNFYLMDSTYWKDGRETSGMDYFRYCAMDTLRTAAVAVAQLLAPKKATFDNFVLSRPRLSVCVVTGLRGFRINDVERKRVEQELLAMRAEAVAEVKALTGYSPSQGKMLQPLAEAIGKLALRMKIPGARELKSLDKNALRDISEWHPFFARLASAIIKARRASMWLSTYVLKEGWSADEHNGGLDLGGSPGEYLLFNLNPFGTDTRRLASTSSALWTGYNAQNVPPMVRAMLTAYPGFELGASDMPAAETRTTAYLSKCNAMREAVEGGRDFHTLNAVEFFGVEYAAVYSDEHRKTLNKLVRDLAKRVNHGANYMMGVATFILTVGITAVLDMQRIMKLPAVWTPAQVVKHVLNRFDERFPEVRNQWAEEQALEIATTGRLDCITGYKPLFLESPLHNKSVLNQAVATEAQHWSAQIALDIFHELYLAECADPESHYTLLQMHDENIFAYPVLPATDSDYVAHRAAQQERLTELYLRVGYAEHACSHIWRDGTPAKLVIPAEAPVFGVDWSEIKS